MSLEVNQYQRTAKQLQLKEKYMSLAGMAAAITAAVQDATGVRVRELPVKVENLLKPCPLPNLQIAAAKTV